MRRAVRAEPGADGAGRNKTGRDGRSVEIEVPVGTLVTEISDESHEVPVADLVRDGQPRVQVVLAGDAALEERFASPKLASFAQRVAARDLRFVAV